MVATSEGDGFLACTGTASVEASHQFQLFMRSINSFPSIRTATTRRAFLRGLGVGGMFFGVRGAFAEALTLTAAQTEGPFYPDHLPLDTDNDLLLINDAATPALGARWRVSHHFADVATAAGVLSGRQS